MPLTSSVWANFKLKQGTHEPGSFKLSANGGAAVLVGTIPSEDLETILSEGVETAVADNSTGLIRRTNPVCHPRFNHLFLDTIDNVVGVSFKEKVDADPEGLLEVPPLPAFADYRKYEVTATFVPRLYPMVEDTSLDAYTINYYDEDGGPQSKNAFSEFWRNVDWYRDPASETLTADQGQIRWSNPPGAGDLNTGPEDGSSAGTGIVRRQLPLSTWKAIWHCVPYQYVLSDSTYFERYIGYVNQAEIFGWLPGQGLLQAIKVLRVYTPPFPDFTDFDGSYVPAQDKLCDIEFTFLSTPRTATFAVTPTNASHVIDGHNSQYFRFGQKAYYTELRVMNVGVVAAAGEGLPSFPSVPFDLLFQNPDGP